MHFGPQHEGHPPDSQARRAVGTAAPADLCGGDGGGHLGVGGPGQANGTDADQAVRDAVRALEQAVVAAEQAQGSDATP